MSTPPWDEQPDGQPPPPYQPYAAPGSPYSGYPTVPQTNGLAIASLAVSVAGTLVCCGFSGIVGAILGHVSRKQIREQPNQTGAGVALAGIIVGWVSFGLALVGTIAYILLVALAVTADTVDDDEYCYTDTTGQEVCY